MQAVLSVPEQFTFPSQHPCDAGTIPILPMRKFKQRTPLLKVTQLVSVPRVPATLGANRQQIPVVSLCQGMAWKSPRIPNF